MEQITEQNRQKHAAVLPHICTNRDCDIITPRGLSLKAGHCTFLFPPKSDGVQGLYLLNVSCDTRSNHTGDRRGLKIDPAHRQTLGVNDISISEEQDAVFEIAAL